MRSHTELERLAAARPAPRTDAVAPTVEREALIRSILADKPELVSGGVSARQTARLAGIGMAALAATAVAVIAAGGPPVDSPAVPSTASPGSRPMVLERVELAMASAELMVVHVRTDFDNGVLWETWLDQASATWHSASRKPDGTPLYAHRVRPGEGGVEVTVVSHVDRAWWTYQAPDERGEPNLHPTPQDIRAQLADGTLVDAGRELIDGVEAIRLHGEAKEKAPGVYVAGGDLWVNPTTYLPLRHHAIGRNGRAIASDYRWLPRTADHLRHVDLSVPTNYAHLAAPPITPGEQESERS